MHLLTVQTQCHVVPQPCKFACSISYDLVDLFTAVAKAATAAANNTAVLFGCLRPQVDQADVAAFSLKLLQELSLLVQSTVAAQQEDDVEGLCQLCEREMPLTKHHLIPRWAATASPCCFDRGCWTGAL